MKPKNYNTKMDLHYLKNEWWRNGKLCYWRNNSNYSERQKKELEKRMLKMTNEK